MTAPDYANAQDYLGMLQVCIAFGAFIAVFLVFRYETIDKYTDNRKEALREILDIQTHPERAAWIQAIGKNDIGVETFDHQLRSLEKPSVDTFIKEIVSLRATRHSLVERGRVAAGLWGLMSIVYLFAQVFHCYDPCCYRLLMLAFLFPLLISIGFLRRALGALH